MMLPNEDEEGNENLADALGLKILNKVTALLTQQHEGGRH
jgi:hypothetical protein